MRGLFVLVATAPECAGVIHSDFQRGFIQGGDHCLGRASECWLMDWLRKTLGKVRSEGKDYIVERWRCHGVPVCSIVFCHCLPTVR